MQKLSGRLILLISTCLVLAGPGKPVASVQTSGSATGDARPPVLDNRNRPITAGGFLPGTPVFEDITPGSGLETFRHRSGSAEKKYILEVPSGGVATFDYDRDGWLDIYLVNGSTFAALEGEEPHPSAALFKNNGDGTFTDVTARAGVGNHRWGFGAVVADFDNDGWKDLFVSNYGADRFYRNQGDGTFQDIAVQAGVALESWSTAASFGDYDRDGLLDLFVAGYVIFDKEKIPAPGSAAGHCEFRGKPVMCGPRGLPGERDFLFRNRGDGTFEEVATNAGVADADGYYGFGAAWADVDDDGWVDLLVANDSTPNYLYRNQGDGTFEDLSYAAGFALNEYARAQAGMGLALGDYDNDGLVDAYVTHFSDDYNTLYRNEGSAFFTDVTYPAGLGEDAIPFLGWGTGFLDFDRDGFLDLFVANGHVYREVDSYDWGTTWAQRPLLFQNKGGKQFQVMPAVARGGLGVVVPARGAAFADFDNDGKVDVVLNNNDSSPRLLRNASPDKNHWISLKLEGRGKSPRDAVGARVFLNSGNMRQRRDVISGASFCSHSDFRLHFGLGSSSRIDQVEIFWPSGTRQLIRDLQSDQFLEIEESQP